MTNARLRLLTLLLVAIALALQSCAAGAGLDLQNSAQYQQEIHPLAVGATSVRAHIQADLARGKTKEQVAFDAGFAVFQEVMLFLASVPPPMPAPASQPAREEDPEPELQPET